MNSVNNQIHEHNYEDRTWLRGWWLQYHYDSLFADQNPERRLHFIDRLNYHKEIFPCEKCINHYKKYILENPPEKEQYMFVYTWKFHNAVNVRLGKPTMDFDDYIRIYKVEGYKCESCSLNKTEKNQTQDNIPKLPREFLFSD